MMDQKWTLSCGLCRRHVWSPLAILLYILVLSVLGGTKEDFVPSEFWEFGCVRASENSNGCIRIDRGVVQFYGKKERGKWAETGVTEGKMATYKMKNIQSKTWANSFFQGLHKKKNNQHNRYKHEK